jgi:hypothetical protein
MFVFSIWFFAILQAGSPHQKEKGKLYHLPRGHGSPRGIAAMMTGKKRRHPFFGQQRFTLRLFTL